VEDLNMTTDKKTMLMTAEDMEHNQVKAGDMLFVFGKDETGDFRDLVQVTTVRRNGADVLFVRRDYLPQPPKLSTIVLYVVAAIGFSLMFYSLYHLYILVR
jgi:hypothetical protein